MAQRNLLAIDNSDLAGRSGARFRAPLTMLGETSRISYNAGIVREAMF
jgi:hypothetical protein